MAPLTVTGIEELQELVGKQIGPSDWREVTQDMIDSFAELSGDDQWIHVDVERAEKESPFGTTVAHGNLTLATIDGFRGGLVVSGGFKLGVNYGWNKVRFPAPYRPARASAPRSRRSPSMRSATAGGRSCSAGPSRSRAPRSPAAWPTPSAARSSSGYCGGSWPSDGSAAPSSVTAVASGSS